MFRLNLGVVTVFTSSNYLWEFFFQSLLIKKILLSVLAKRWFILGGRKSGNKFVYYFNCKSLIQKLLFSLFLLYFAFRVDNRIFLFVTFIYSLLCEGNFLPF